MRKPKNILVTGGSGFIGSNFIRILFSSDTFKSVEKVINLDKLTYAGDLKKNSVYSDNPKYKFIKGDICSEKTVREIINIFCIDTIVNFAAESHVDNSILHPDEFIKTNILGTYNLLKLFNNCDKVSMNKKIFLHVSTDEVFGSLAKDENAFDEMNRYKPNSPYSASKASSDHLVRAWSKTFNLNTIITNCSNNYGPHQDEEKLIPKIIKKAIFLEKIPIYGNGENIRDWLFVDDHCKAILELILMGKFGETYNVGGSNEIKNINIAYKICDLLSELYPIEKNTLYDPSNTKICSYRDLINFVDDRPGHDLRYSINSSKIKNELNWLPSETFETGIRKTISWYIKELSI